MILVFDMIIACNCYKALLELIDGDVWCKQSHECGRNSLMLHPFHVYRCKLLCVAMI